MSPPQPQPQSTQTLQFLSNVLSQRGPTSLPYTEDVKWLIRQHLISLSEAFPSLTPKTATFTHNDGRQVNLLQADGTIPMTYQSVTYNIPVVIWLTESYPRHAPLVFVNPTRDMIIKRPHAHVTPSGLVQIPYLQNWIYPSSSLVELGRNLSVMFGRDPPLYSQQQQQRRGGNSNVSVGHSPSSNVLASNHSQSLNGSMGGGGGVGGGGRMSFPPSPYRTEDPSEVYKRNAVSKIVEMVHGDMVGLRKAREGEMDGLFNAQGVLRKREEEVNKGLKELLDEKEALEQQLQMVLMNTDVLEGWVKENEEKAKKAGGGSVDDVDEAFEIGDVMSKQMLEASAADLALEDVIYSLDKGVQDGVVPFDQYLRNVRLLSREQFFHRAMTAKVRAAQMQARVSNMASRTSQYAL